MNTSDKPTTASSQISTFTSDFHNLQTEVIYQLLIEKGSYLKSMVAHPPSEMFIRAIYPDNSGERVGTLFKLYDFGISDSPVAVVGPGAEVTIINPEFDVSKVKRALFAVLQESAFLENWFSENLDKVKAPPGFYKSPEQKDTPQ